MRTQLLFMKNGSSLRSSWTRLRFGLLFLVAAVGCGGSDQPQVVVYTAVDRGNSEPILERFEAESGIRVLALYDAEAAKTTGLVSRLIAESDRPRCDVFWNNEIVQSLMLAQRGMLDPYSPSTTGGIPINFIDAGHHWTGVGSRARVIVYNTKHIESDDAPRSIFELVEPKWKGKVAIANPGFGTTRTHVAALFAQLGEEKAKQFLLDLLANEVRIVDGNAMVKNLVARAHPGASPIYVGLTDTDDVMSGQADGESIEMVYPDQDGIGTLFIPTSVCLIRKAPHSEAARKLIDFLVSATTETELAANRSGYMSLRSAKLTPKPMAVSFEDLLKQLERSSRWTKGHFHH